MLIRIMSDNRSFPDFQMDYIGKSHPIDGRALGDLPRGPEDPMAVVLPHLDEPKKLPGSGSVVEFGLRMYFLHKAFPDIVSLEYTLRAANYSLGTHTASSTSYVPSVGTSSKLKAYGNNRADNTFIPGGVIPGYVIIKPYFPECIDDFGFRWFEHEYVIGEAASSFLAANAADAIVVELSGK